MNLLFLSRSLFCCRKSYKYNVHFISFYYILQKRSETTFCKKRWDVALVVSFLIRHNKKKKQQIRAKLGLGSCSVINTDVFIFAFLLSSKIPCLPSARPGCFGAVEKFRSVHSSSEEQNRTEHTRYEFL